MTRAPIRALRRMAPRCAALLACLLLAACGGEPARVTVFAMEGPPLAVAGEQGELELLTEEAAAFPDADGGTEVSARPKVLVRERVVFEGELERAGMVGNGAFMLKTPDNGKVCQGEIKSGPGYKGRIRGIVPCGAGEFFMFTLNHHGPDQGAGIGRFAWARGWPASGRGVEEAAAAPEPEAADLEIEEGPPLLFFYHPSMDEAKRRLTDMQANLARHLDGNVDKKKEGGAEK